MLIIVEGPDGVGKTTLSRTLVAQIGDRFPDDQVEYRHSGPPRGNPIDAYAASLYDYRPGRGRHLVLDRWHLGELVYPEVLDRPTTYDDATHRWVEMLLMSRGATLVHVTDTESNIAYRVARRGDDLVTVKQAAGEVRTSFTYHAGRSLLEKIEIRTPGMARGWSDVVRRVVALAVRNDRPAARLNDLVTYVGPTRPTRLLLGDRRGRRGDPPWTTVEPAFVPYRGTSGYYLMTTLDSISWTAHDLDTLFDLNTVGIMNACDADDLSVALKTLAPTQVTTLGRRAQRALMDLGPIRTVVPSLLGIRHVPHPQYVRRFRHDDVSDYATHISCGVEPGWM